jgi:hypothetical protein
MRWKSWHSVLVMKHITYIHRTALLSLLSLSFGVSAGQAEESGPKLRVTPRPKGVEISDPFTKGAAETDSKIAKIQGAEMLDAQARILFARGETEKAIALQTQAVEQAKETASKFADTLAKYAGHPVDGPIMKKLNEIIIPTINFEDTSLEEAIDYLRVRAVELDAAEPDSSKKGVNFVIRGAKAAAADLANGSPGEPAVIPEPRITNLRLKNVPLSSALQYICDATLYYFTVDGFTVTLKPLPRLMIRPTSN